MCQRRYARQSAAGLSAAKKVPIAVQLYSVRHIAQKDLAGVLSYRDLDDVHALWSFVPEPARPEVRNGRLRLEVNYASADDFSTDTTSSSLAGSWTPHLATESNPFARSNNVTFNGAAWTRDFSHGELIRAGNDQTLPLNPCRMQFLYQGQDPNAGGDYIRLPWRMGLLTQTNASC